jgi:hypothetical protein
MNLDIKVVFCLEARNINTMLDLKEDIHIVLVSRGEEIWPKRMTRLYVSLAVADIVENFLMLIDIHRGDGDNWPLPRCLQLAKLRK